MLCCSFIRGITQKLCTFGFVLINNVLFNLLYIWIFIFPQKSTNQAVKVTTDSKASEHSEPTTLTGRKIRKIKMMKKTLCVLETSSQKLSMPQSDLQTDHSCYHVSLLERPEAAHCATLSENLSLKSLISPKSCVKNNN